MSDAKSSEFQVLPGPLGKLRGGGTTRPSPRAEPTLGCDLVETWTTPVTGTRAAEAGLTTLSYPQDSGCEKGERGDDERDDDAAPAIDAQAA
jgi:hypothetical protein